MSFKEEVINELKELVNLEEPNAKRALDVVGTGKYDNYIDALSESMSVSEIVTSIMSQE
jgi:hypothetical protein